MSSLLEKLQSFQERRKFPDWQPKPCHSRFYGIRGNQGVLERLLQLIDLEVSVGEWIQQAKHRLPSDVHQLIDRNSSDELKHDTVLRYLTSYVGLVERSEQATALVNEWQSQQPSFALAYALEMGIFMSILPWLTKHGDLYCATVSQWISEDEVVHVLTNRELAAELRESVSGDLCSLVARTIYYILEPEGHQEAVYQAKRSIRRISTGEDPSASLQSTAIVTAFFEQNERAEIMY
jgi:hypothetical protein